MFLKLCDFNIVKVLEIKVTFEDEQAESEDHPNELTRNAGTKYYIAPEVKTGIYDNKSDMFGLALIATQIFCFEDSVEKISPKLTRVMYTEYMCYCGGLIGLWFGCCVMDVLLLAESRFWIQISNKFNLFLNWKNRVVNFN